MAKKAKILPSVAWLEPRVKAMRVLSLLSFFALAGLLAAYYLLFADLHGARPWVILLVELIPWLVLAPGMIMGSARGHSWMCFVVNLYFIKGALAAYDPHRQLFGLLEMAASLAVFCSALLYVRWRYQLNRKLAGEGDVSVA
ncbi:MULTISPECIES: DUF2069 domain-containing protein [unclassified Pseudomonas]|uniref:DUF2069 domain-containing protein n=1 Tax=unclassified Pseudomonas TaxID=196821 RepID=UPI001648A678|nr:MULTISPECIES: DUF2069 domain-containing protein [unclassified Pseudomonas]MBC3271976.1 DUF2069 domain-containing protein [Pseudomonas sp. SWRI81]MBC3779093.1 DUF2069 domain-containing protein [Pseudomonas sp. SWRI99]